MRSVINESSQRPVLGVVGLAAGLTAWLMAEIMPELLNDDRLYLWVASSSFGVFSVLLGLLGPSRFMRALPVAIAIGGVSGALLTWASWRHDDISSFLGLGYPLAAYGLILFVSLPFAAAYLRESNRWRDYPLLFDFSWRILVRYLAAGLFLGVFWALVFLSDALLRIVQITAIDQLLDIEAVPYLLSGAVFGLALAVVYEMRAYMSAFLVLRLLQMLLPVVLVVVLVFVLALPFRGLSGLVGSLSPAATLMTVALAAVTLITVSVAQDDEGAATGRVFGVSAQALALIVPLLGGLSVYAVWMRVEQYSWTPNRLAAATAAGVITIYGVTYALSVLRRGAWMARIRAANVVVALGLLGICTVWLTPVFVPEQISANAQLALYASQHPTTKLPPLFELKNEWGVAGKDAIGRFEVTYPEVVATAEYKKSLETRYNQATTKPVDISTDLVAELPVFPEGSDVAPTLLSGLSPYWLKEIRSACQRSRKGNPGCALIVASFHPDHDTMRGILFLRQEGGRVRAMSYRYDEGELSGFGSVQAMRGVNAALLPDTVLDQIFSGGFAVKPSTSKALFVDGFELLPNVDTD